MKNQHLLNENQAAEFLGYSVKTLQSFRWRKVGPQYLKLNGGGVRYRPEDLDEFVNSSIVETRSSDRSTI